MICALTITAAVAVPSIVSAQDDFYSFPADILILWEQPDVNSDFRVFEDAYDRLLIVRDYQNGFGYCYIPELSEYGWVDMDDVDPEYEIPYEFQDF